MEKITQFNLDRISLYLDLKQLISNKVYFSLVNSIIGSDYLIKPLIENDLNYKN